MKAVVEVVAVDEVEDGDMVMGEVARVVGLIETLPTVRTLMHLKMEWVVRQLKDVDMVGLVVVVAVGVVSMMEKMLKGNALVEHLNATVELAVGKCLLSVLLNFVVHTPAAYSTPF